MSNPFTPEEQAAQLRRPHGPGSDAIAAYMQTQNAALYELTMRHLPLKPGFQVAEIGPGDAPLAGRIVGAAEGIQYTGIDYSPEMTGRAGQHWAADSHRIHFACAEIAAMPLKDQSCDVVFGINVHYFWDHPEKELAEIRRVLKPGGTLILGYRPKNKMQAIPFTRYGFNLYDEVELAALLNSQGFRPETMITEAEPPRLIAGQELPMDRCVIVAVRQD